MTTATVSLPIAQTVSRKPLVAYFDPISTQPVREDELVHDYYGVPTWLMAEYLSKLGAVQVDGEVWEKGACRMEIAKAPIKRIGSLEIGGATVHFTGTEGAVQQVLTDLEWMTLRC